MIKSWLMQFRQAVIRAVAGKMGICLNCTLVMDDRHGAGISYAKRNGGMCENLH